MDFGSLDRVLDQLKPADKRILLIGNGFSVECCNANGIKDLFSYSTLADLVKDKEIIGTQKTLGDLLTFCKQ